MTTNNPRFPLGQLAATPRALAALAAAGQSAAEFLHRHQCGDYGVVNDEDRKANDAAVQCGERVFSAYLLSNGTKVWLITEADRSSSVILLPDEY
jgi:hypothetical protein